MNGAANAVPEKVQRDIPAEKKGDREGKTTRRELRGARARGAKASGAKARGARREAQRGRRAMR